MEDITQLSRIPREIYGCKITMEEQYTTNVIEIKPDKKYLFILECPMPLSMEQYQRIRGNFERELKKRGLSDSFALVFESDMKTKILEIDKAIETDDQGHDLQCNSGIGMECDCFRSKKMKPAEATMS